MTTAETVSKNGAAIETVIGVGFTPLEIGMLKLRVEGDTPLITNRWSEKAKGEMLAKQMKKSKQAKKAKDPVADFANSLYWMDGQPSKKPTKKQATGGIQDTRFGFPSVGFKAAAVNACSHITGLTKVLARGAMHIDGELVEVHGAPIMREDMVRIAMGTADIRFRGEFPEWWAEFIIRYNTSVISEEQIANLFNVAGFASGIGEWRPQKGGSYGMFHVVSAD